MYRVAFNSPYLYVPYHVDLQVLTVRRVRCAAMSSVSVLETVGSVTTHRVKFLHCTKTLNVQVQKSSVKSLERNTVTLRPLFVSTVVKEQIM
jgi:hypothetical protein